jgi:hypothetical protein
MDDLDCEKSSTALPLAQSAGFQSGPRLDAKPPLASLACNEPISRIVILCHPADAFAEPPFLIHALMEQWRQRNLRVEVAFEIEQPAAPGLVVIPHLDMTRWPKSFQNAYASCPIVLNRAVTDISKRLISRNLVTSPREYDGPVIVKTDRNSGGEPERNMLMRRGLPGRAMASIARRLPWSIGGVTGLAGYKIYDHPSQAPWPVWRNPRLVVEKFLPERQDDQFVLRQYIFLGSRELNRITFGPNPIVKVGNGTRRESVSQTPPELRAIRAQLGFDFGKFDYVIRGGQVVLFDVNRTPTYNRAKRTGSASQAIIELASGIDAFGQIP